MAALPSTFTPIPPMSPPAFPGPLPPAPYLAPWTAASPAGRPGPLLTTLRILAVIAVLEGIVLMAIAIVATLILSSAVLSALSVLSSPPVT